MKKTILMASFLGCTLALQTPYLDASFKKGASFFAAFATAATYRHYQTTMIPIAPEITVENLNIISFEPTTLDATVTKTNSMREVITQIPSKNPIDTAIALEDGRHFTVRNAIPKLKNPTDTIFIYCHGWIGNFLGHPLRGKGIGAAATYNYIKRDILQGVTIAFDFPTDRPQSFNLAQEDDMATVTLILQKVTEINPDARIVLVGDSRGAATILNVMTHADALVVKNVSAVAIECPPISLERVAHDLAWHLPIISSLVHTCVQYALPRYTPGAHIKTVFNGRPFSAHVPIFIGRVMCDSQTHHAAIQEIADHIQKSGHKQVYLYSYTPTLQQQTRQLVWHAKMAQITEYQQAVNAFFKRHSLPHNSAYAEQGIAALLESTQQ
ncbi:MAG TPA: cutinase family protein [Candidatus Babeliales bacterium]|nr:cutinase family protein [Candidatus Babeliales bacterium]